MDIAAARADIERRLHDKEEEFEATRKNFARAIARGWKRFHYPIFAQNQ